jgi:outer membrane protein assembly factor BamA
MRRILSRLLLTGATFGLAATGAADVAPVAPGPDDPGRAGEGARIGHIVVRLDDIFDTSDPREDGPLYRAANRLHWDTRESTVRAQLLFAEGDAYSRRLLQETERNLRRLRFLTEPTVRPVACHDGVVDVEVHARDVWTLNPGVSVGRAGGENSGGFGVEDLNLLGTGKQLSLGLSTDVDRSTMLVGWHDPNVFGSRWTDTIELADSDDGYHRSLAVERPFFSLSTPWNAGLAIATDRHEQDRYVLGEVEDAYLSEQQSADLHYGWSAGLRDGWTRRLTAGFRYDDTTFSALPDTGPAAVPQDRRLAYPYVKLELIEDGYTVTRNQDQIDRTEDVNFGRRLELQLGLAAPAFGADRSAGVLGAAASRGWRLSEDRQAFVDLGLSARLESGGLTDSLLSGSARYYWRTSKSSMLFVGLSGDVGHALDGDHDLLLGGDNGLRGYPLRYQSGSSRALLTVEERIFTDWYPLRLMHVGGAVFADVGRTWGRDSLDTPNLGLLKDVGFGLRLGNARSALGNVLHLDFAFPLDGDSSIRDVQILLKTHKSF